MATPAWPEAMLLLYLSSSTIRSGLFQTSNMGSQTGPDPEIQTLRSSDPEILRCPDPQISRSRDPPDPEIPRCIEVLLYTSARARVRETQGLW